MVLALPGRLRRAVIWHLPPGAIVIPLKARFVALSGVCSETAAVGQGFCPPSSTGAAPGINMNQRSTRGVDYRVFWRRAGTPQLSVQIAIVEYHYNGAGVGNFRKIVGVDVFRQPFERT